MASYILKKSDLAEFVESLAGEFPGGVLGPVLQDGKIVLAAAEPREFRLDFQNTHLSPKDLFFPQSEKMLEFTANPGEEGAFILEEVKNQPQRRLVLGLRPCDAKAFVVLDTIFTNDQYSDPYWAEKREATVIIGLDCNEPCPTCFCTSMGSGPFHEEGQDVQAVDLGDRLLLKPLTSKGEEVLKKAQGLTPAAPADKARAQELKQQAEATITDEVETDNIAARTVMELFEAPHWDEVQERCLNCGVCTYVCPTCHCFDIQDEVHEGKGVRLRNWDYCMSWLFTQHGSGHNPRPDKKSRVRQRFMHKFKYIPLKREGAIGCVGCGRCITLCPVNIDVRDVVRDMNS
ncbi:MAG: 4Fe-4S dicluster domain-containing protein [Deltaproteobacteria bacterium]|jgi:sulfhydrogenase subunit beta (sulfur reductase)